MAQRSYLLAVQLTVNPITSILGFNRFYLGKIGTGILKVLVSSITFGIGAIVWYLYDLLILLYNKETDIDGKPLDGQDKRDPVMLVYLSFFCMDRFFLGQTVLGVVKLLTAGGLGVWWAIDIYLALKGKQKDAKDRPIETDAKRYQGVALLFSLNGGYLGLDRFYLGHVSTGLLKLCTFGGFGLWWLIDLIQIINNNMKDVNGNVLSQE